jgi:hypothetical protein
VVQDALLIQTPIRLLLLMKIRTTQTMVQEELELFLELPYRLVLILFLNLLLWTAQLPLLIQTLTK